MGLRPFLVLLFKFLVFVCDASLRADAGHRADDRVIIVRTGLRPGKHKAGETLSKILRNSTSWYFKSSSFF